SDKMRDLAPVRYEINFDGQVLTVDGKARLDFFRPEPQAEAEEFALIAESDDGKAFFDFLVRNKQAEALALKRSRSSRWFVDFRLERKLIDIDKVAREASPPSPYTCAEHPKVRSAKPGPCPSCGLPLQPPIANPGPFVGEVDSFDLGATAFRQQGAFDR